MHASLRETAAERVLLEPHRIATQVSSRSLPDGRRTFSRVKQLEAMLAPAPMGSGSECGDSGVQSLWCPARDRTGASALYFASMCWNVGKLVGGGTV